MGKHCQLLTQHHFVQNFLWFWSLVLAFNLLALPATAQRPTQKDSLLKVLETLPDDTSKVQVLHKLSILCTTNDTKNALRYGNKAFDLAQIIKYPYGTARSLAILGRAYRISGDYDQAIEKQNESQKIWRQINDSLSLANSFQELGIVYRKKGEFSLSLRNLLKALKVHKHLKSKKGEANVATSLSTLYIKQKDYDKAVEYSKLALKLHKELNLQSAIAIDYNNLGNIYYFREAFDKSLYYYNQYKFLKEQLGDKRSIGIALSNIGFVYAQKKQYLLNIDYQKKALKIFKDLNLENRQIYPLQSLGESYADLGEFDKAVEHGTDALRIAENIGGKFKTIEVLESLARIERKANNYKQALKYYQQYKLLSDTVFNEKKTKLITEMQTKYDTEKKEQENKILKLEVKQRNNLIAAAVGGVVLLLILAIVLYQSNRRKQKTNRVLVAQKQEIEIQTEEIMAQRDMLEQQHKDIRDSINYARKIQTAILPLKEEISAALPEHFLFYQPRDIVSGDFYWFAKIEEATPKYVIAISDCTGHGVPGAFMSMIGNDLLNDIVKARHIVEPDRILDLLHVGVRKALHQETGENSDGMDIALCVIDPQQKTVSYAGANSPLVYVKDGELTRVAPNKTSIGGSKTKFDKGFQAHTIAYQDAPVMCYLYSDGYRDQFGGEKGKKFMRPRFLELVFYISQLSMQEQRRQIEETITEWMKQGGYDQMDDMLVMGFRLS